jgi:hypothetical protein
MGLVSQVIPADQKYNSHYPSYIFNVGATRSLGHVVATASVINVALRLAKQPLLAL